MQPPQHYRKPLRLPGYDYSQQGAYFVTVVTNHRLCLLGDVFDGEMRPNSYGQIVMRCWDDLVHHYPQVSRDEFVVMPNRVHGILILNDVGAGLEPNDVGAGLKPASTQPNRSYKRLGLPEIVRGFKTFSARHINALRNTRGVAVWQRNYYEHVIRSERELDGTREYILNNPLQWELDTENPANVRL